MFRQLVGLGVITADQLVSLCPSERLQLLLHLIWNNRSHVIALPVGHPDHRSDIEAAAPPPPPISVFEPDSLRVRLEVDGERSLLWDHLIYAYLVENTGIYQIFRRVLHEFLHGEKLGTPSPDTQAWLQNTEELFYRDPAPFSIRTITSYIRPDLQASRLNAYQRTFGMELNPGTFGDKPYPYVKADAGNAGFVDTFEELLREVWVGMTNWQNKIGANPTDDGKIANLATKLCDMLRSRRQGGNLSREEFTFVSMMSWFHLAVEHELPVIKDLRADGVSPEQRLFKIAQRVGVPAHGLSKSYFDLADPMSRFLIQIEMGTYNNIDAVQALYTPVDGGPEKAMRDIITHWSIITGRDMKAGKVATT